MTQRNKTRNRLLAGAAGLALLINAACTDTSEQKRQADSAPPAAAQRPETLTREDRIAMRQQMVDSRPAMANPMQESSTEPPEAGVTGEVPADLLDNILADLEERTGAKRSEFEILRAEATQWNDGGLGCPEPGQDYTQAIIDGYRVVLEYAGETYDYHAAAIGYFKLCKGFRPNRPDYPVM